MQNKLFTLLVLLFITHFSIAQVQVGSNSYSKKAGKISKEAFKDLKATTTYFILQDRDYEHKANFEKALSKVWTVTPFEVVTAQEAKTKSKSKSSFFDFTGYVIARQGKSITTYHTHVNYTLFNYAKNKKGKYIQQEFANIAMHLDNEGYQKSMELMRKNKKDFSRKLSTFIHKDANIGNWSPSTFLGYLKLVNEYLTEEKTRSVFDGFKDSDLLKTLQNDTLYVPNYVNIKFNKFNGAEKDREIDEDDIAKTYPFPIKYVTIEELNELIFYRPGGVKYVTYVKSSTDKFVSVFDSKTGDLLYTDYTPMSYNFKNKDLGKIAKKVK